MGKGLLFLVGAFVIAGGSLLFGTVNQSSIHKTELAGNYASSLMARELAHTGVQDALQQLSNAYENAGSYSGPLTWSGTYEGGNYSNTVTISGSNHSIISTGTIDGEQYVISRQYNYSPGSAIPPAMNRPLTSDSTIQFNYDAVIDSPYFSGVADNATIHSNQEIIINSGWICIFGFGNRVSNLQILNAQQDYEIFIPHNNPDSDPLSPVVSAIDIPEVDASSYMGGATFVDSDGIDLSGSYTLGTEESPAVWYIDGDLTTSSDVTFNGYGIILVTGDVFIHNDIEATAAYDEGSVAIYSQSRIKALTQDIEIEAHLYANDYIYMADEVEVLGTLTTKAHFDLGYNFYTYYIPPSSSIVTPVASGVTPGFELETTREWAVN